jgi:uncharacterized protein (DUF4415 family)
MSEKKRGSRTDLKALDAHVVTAAEYADIPELTDDWFEKADHHRGGKLIRRGRPPAAVKKEAVSIRLSPDVLQYFRATGAGWQTRIDAELRRIVKERSRNA